MFNSKAFREKNVNEALGFIYMAFDWNPNFYLKEGYVYESVEYATSHRWTEEEKVRKASEIDLAVFKILDKIKEEQRKEWQKKDAAQKLLRDAGYDYFLE